jgi:hypothetical protein
MPAARTFLLLPPLGIALSVLGCSKSEATSASDAGLAASAPLAIDAGTLAAPTPRAGGRRRDGRHGDAGVLSSTARAGVIRDLNEGRKLSQAKDWAGAIKAFDRALAVAPDDVRVLSELGWAAFQANELSRAETANKRALANAKSPKLRAPILYNMGRVAEARGDKKAAVKAYAESLALRDNAEVKKRLGALDGGVPESVAASRPCDQPFANVAALCTCLRGRKEDLLASDDVTMTCEPETTPPLGDPRLGVVVWGAEVVERPHLLTVKEGDRVRAIVELGRDYEPGAFGVHNEAEVKGGEKRSVNGHDVVVVRSEQRNADQNLAGLELCFDHEKLETVCALGDKPDTTKCTPPIPVEVESGCGPGVEPDEADLDDETRKMVANIKKNATRSRATTAWSVSNDGTVTVTLQSGSRDAVDASILRPHVLWR